MKTVLFILWVCAFKLLFVGCLLRANESFFLKKIVAIQLTGLQSIYYWKWYYFSCITVFKMDVGFHSVQLQFVHSKDNKTTNREKNILQGTKALNDSISWKIYFTFHLREMSRTYDCVVLCILHRIIMVTSDRCIN